MSNRSGNDFEIETVAIQVMRKEVGKRANNNPISFGGISSLLGILSCRRR